MYARLLPTVLANWSVAFGPARLVVFQTQGLAVWYIYTGVRYTSACTRVREAVCTQQFLVRYSSCMDIWPGSPASGGHL